MLPTVEWLLWEEGGPHEIGRWSPELLKEAHAAPLGELAGSAEVLLKAALWWGRWDPASKHYGDLKSLARRCILAERSARKPFGLP